jgi:hypothetical protein
MVDHQGAEVGSEVRRDEIFLLNCLWFEWLGLVDGDRGWSRHERDTRSVDFAVAVFY